MSGYGPPRGWRGSNAWGAPSARRETTTSAETSAAEAAAADVRALLDEHTTVTGWPTALRDMTNVELLNLRACLVELLYEREQMHEAADLREEAHDEFADLYAAAFVRAEQAEAEIDRLRALIADEHGRLSGTIEADAAAYEDALEQIHHDRDHWQRQATAAFEHAERAERDRDTYQKAAATAQVLADQRGREIDRLLKQRDAGPAEVGDA